MNRMEGDELFSREIKSMHDILNDGKIDQVRELRHSKIFSSLLANRGCEVINSISIYLDDERLYKYPDVIHCYKEILQMIVEESDAQDSFITLLEQMDEEHCRLEKFLLLLTPLRMSLQKLHPFREHWLEWALSTIKCYLDTLPAPEDYQIESNEKKMLVNDRYISSIMHIMKTVLLFYSAFLGNTSSKRGKDALVEFGFHLLTKPMMYVYLENFSDLRSICHDVISNIHLLNPHIHCIMKYLDDRNRTNVKDHDSNSGMDDEGEDCSYPNMCAPMSPLSLAVYYSIVIEREPFLNYFPLIYDKIYLFHKLFFLSVVLLKHTHNAAIRKGLLLCRCLLLSLEDGCIPHYYLELQVHREFVKVASYVSTYSYILENRKIAVELLQFYVRKFDHRATYLLYNNIMSATNNSDVDSEIITLFRKDMHASFLKNDLQFYQKGKLLIDLLKVYSDLGGDGDMDVMSYKNKIISTLHLFALIWRRDVKNDTTIHTHFKYFEKNYFSKIKDAIRKSRETLNREANALMNANTDIHSAKCINPSRSNEIFDVIVDGKSLSELSQEEKSDAIKNELTALIMIEHALQLVYEYAGQLDRT